MSKHTLTIEVTSEDGGDRALQPYLNANKVLSFIWDWEQFMREKYKYSDDDSTTWDKVREAWFNMKNEEGIVDYDI